MDMIHDGHVCSRIKKQQDRKGRRRSTPQVNKPTTMSHNKNGTVDGQKYGQTVYIVVGGMFAHEQQQRKFLVMTNYAR